MDIVLMGIVADGHCSDRDSIGGHCSNVIVLNGHCFDGDST